VIDSVRSLRGRVVFLSLLSSSPSEPVTRVQPHPVFPATQDGVLVPQQLLRYPQELAVFNLDKEDTWGGKKVGGDRKLCREIG